MLCIHLPALYTHTDSNRSYKCDQDLIALEANKTPYLQQQAPKLLAFLLHLKSRNTKSIYRNI